MEEMIRDYLDEEEITKCPACGSKKLYAYFKTDDSYLIDFDNEEIVSPGPTVDHPGTYITIKCRDCSCTIRDEEIFMEG